MVAEGAQLGHEVLCFLSHMRPQGSNAQSSRASLCAAHGRPTFPENPHPAKVRMDTEGLGANSSLGAAPSWAQSPGPRALPSPVTLWTEISLQAEKHAPHAKKAS